MTGSTTSVWLEVAASARRTGVCLRASRSCAACVRSARLPRRRTVGARGDGVRVRRPAVLRAVLQEYRAAIGRARQRRLRHRGDEVDRPCQSAAGREGSAAGRRLLVERAGSHAGVEIARRARAVPVAGGARDRQRRSRIPRATGPASRRAFASSSTTRTRSRPSDAPRSVFDLADPRWKDQVAIADPRFGSTSFHVAALYARARRRARWTTTSAG